MSIESEVYLDIARILNIGPGEVEKSVRDYIEAVTCDFKPLKLYSKPRVCIKPVKIKSLKERLEEATMHADCEFCVKRDICTRDVPKPCNYRYTEDERRADQASDIYGAILAGMYLPKTYQKKEETQMKATSVQTIENVKEMHLTTEKSTMDKITKVIVGASTNDDIFEFHLSGEGCAVFIDQWFKMVADKAYKADFESERNKRQMMERENNLLREKIKNLEHADMLDKEARDGWLEEYYKLSKKFDKLQEENEALKKELALEKAANEAQHKFIRKYAGKDTEIGFNYAIDDAKDVSYVIVEKNMELAEENNKLKEAIQKYHEENQQLDEENDNLLERVAILQDENLELKYQLGDIQTTKEVVDQKLNTRAGILDQAKKCVCGQREQDYGTPESNFQLIADLWNDYPKKERLGRSKTVVDAVDVSMMMALMKIARIKNGGGSGDSFVDLAGYAACGGEIWHGQKVKDQN